MDIYQKYKEIFDQCFLFRGFSPEEIEVTLEKSYLKCIELEKNEIYTLPVQLKELYFVLEGKFNVLQDSGMNMSLSHTIVPGYSFGTAFCTEDIPCYNSFCSHRGGKIIALSYEKLLGQGNLRIKILENLLAITSRHLEMLADKINHTQAHAVRVRLSIFLRDQMLKNRSETFQMNLSRKDTADYLNITYPAMLREISRMKKENIIKIENDTITILDLDALIEEGSDYNIL